MLFKSSCVSTLSYVMHYANKGFLKQLERENHDKIVRMEPTLSSIM